MIGFLLYFVLIAFAYIRRFRKEFAEEDIQMVGAYLLVVFLVWVVITVISSAS